MTTKQKSASVVNPEEKTLKFIDNGLGMTADEVEEYINQIAFSGATDFLREVQGQGKRRSDHRTFRTGLLLRFYGSGRGCILIPLSYKEGATPVHWECDGGTEL